MNWDHFWPAFVASLPALLAALAAFVKGFQNGWIVAESKEAVKEVHSDMNGRLDQLIAKHEQVAHELGRLKGIEEQKAIQRDSKP